MEFTVLKPNDGGDTLWAILGPIGSHWVQKMGQNVENYHAPKFYFSTTRRSSIIPKKWKLRLWRQITVGTPRGHLGANVVPLGPKNGPNVENYLAPNSRIFDDPAVIDFSKKMEVSVIAPNHDGDPLGAILGPMGSNWVKKMGQNRKKLLCSKIRIFDYPAVIDFSKKMEVSVIAPNHSGDPLGSILGPMGSHWVKKMGQNRKKLPCPKIRIFDYSSIFLKKRKLRLWRQVTVRNP